jgi:tyrosine-protein kinase Etk/Wzc
VRLVDREDAITDLADRLSTKNAGGDAVEILYSGRDSTTAAQVPNLLARVYMLRRTTVDRGLNQRRLEFLTARADTVRRDLRRGVDSLAHLQTASGAGVDAGIAAKGIADQFANVQAQLAQLSASQHALDSLVSLVKSGHTDPRALAGFPDLLRSAAINDIVGSIAQLETQRTVLLARVAPTAPQVTALQHARDSLTAQLLPMAEAYRQSLARQRASLQTVADSLEIQLNRLPGREAGVVKQEADVKQLSELDAGMGAQVLQARLAAMLEGGDVRLVDTAAVPRKVAFPRPVPTWLVGLLGGLVLGLLLVPIAGPERAA